MATFNTTAAVTGSAAKLLPQLRVARADTVRCGYSKEGLKACSAMNLSPAALKGLGLRRVSTRPWGSKLVDERRMDAEDTSLRRLSAALSPERVVACVVGYIFFSPRRLRRCYDDRN